MSYIIPFGKYQNKPIEELLKDDKYIEWLKAQYWLESKYPEIYKRINKSITTVKYKNDNPTPYHNKIQNLFLKQIYRIYFFEILFNFENVDDNVDVEFEGENNWDIILTLNVRDKYFCTRRKYNIYCEIKTSVGEEYPCILRKLKQQMIHTKYTKEYTRFCLLIDKLRLSETTFEDFILIFKLSNIEVILLEDIQI